MPTLREKFRTFDLDKMAEALGTKKIYLQQIYGGHCIPSEALARSIVRYSAGVIRMADLLPIVAAEMDEIQELQSKNRQEE